MAERILVVDDDEQIRILLQEALEREGYLVEVAADGEEAVRLFRANPSRLVVTDIVMPEKEGLETISELRRLSQRVRIIAISGGGHISPERYLRLASSFGADRSFFKPVDLKELTAAVRELLASASDP